MATDNENQPDELNEEENIEETDDENYVELYSKRAIWGFTIFFSTLFGGILLTLNLRAAGYKKAALTVFLFSLGYTMLAVLLVNYLGTTNNFAGMFFNIVGGAILTEYFFKKYFPDDDYYPRPIWGALAVGFILILALVLMIMYTPGLKEQLQVK
ncbi:MAG: hypothetical protein EOP47_19385 [Sphingobacteriaceae bacterium]|nr:MAG: hypothetical protein EOP47_19385 [Sphingobacteriaceae bacterium]